jgi:hypothetical protein
MNYVIRVRDVRFIDKLYRDKPSTQRVEPYIIEAVQIHEKKCNSDTIVVTQPIKQRQATVTSSPNRSRSHNCLLLQFPLMVLLTLEWNNSYSRSPLLLGLLSTRHLGGKTLIILLARIQIQSE